MVETRMQACRIVRAWMQQVLDDKSWSANEWARAARTSPTNLTRLLGGGDKVPSLDTVMKLASVARSQPDLLGWLHAAPDLPASASQPKFCPQCGHNLQPVSKKRPRLRAVVNGED